MVQKPNVLVAILLVEGYGEAVGDVENALAAPTSEKSTDDAGLGTSLVHPVVVVNDAEEDERVNDHLGDGDLGRYGRHVVRISESRRFS